MLKLEKNVRIGLASVAAVFLMTVAIVALFGGSWQVSSGAAAPESSASSAESEASSLPAETSSPAEAPAPSQASLSTDGGATDVARAGDPAVYLTLAETPVFSQPNAQGERLSVIPAKSEVTAVPTQDPLWYQLVSEQEGAPAYIYTECLGRLETEQPLFAEYLQQKMAELQEKLPQDRYWNHQGDDTVPWETETPWSVTDIPCEHWSQGERYCNFYAGAQEELFGGSMNECLGFASLLSDEIYGKDAPLHTYETPGMLRVGDHIRLQEYEHSMIVIAIHEGGIQVAECNENYEDCRISWNRVVSWEELEDLWWDAEFISRYPFASGPYRGFLPWA